MISIFYSFEDIHAALEPLSAQIADVEDNIEAIVRRNDVANEEIQGMKTDIQSLFDKILVIKVSSIRFLFKNDSYQCDIYLYKENINGTTTFGATCEQYFELGSRRNGTYSIRPDISRNGKIHLHLFLKILLIETFLNLKESHSFKVECLFSSEGGQTVVYPINWPEEGFTFPGNESERCSQAFCHKKEVEYVPSKIQMKSLMALSSNCTQKVSHRCNINALTGYSSWIDSNGTANSYWHGNRNSGSLQFFAFDTRVSS